MTKKYTEKKKRYIDMTEEELVDEINSSIEEIQKQVDKESSVTIEVKLPFYMKYKDLTDTQKNTFDSVINQTDDWFKSHIEYYVGKRYFLDGGEILIMGSQDNLEDDKFQEMLEKFNYYDSETLTDDKGVELICLVGRADKMSWIKGNFSDKEFLKSIEVILLTTMEAWSSGLVPEWTENEMEF